MAKTHSKRITLGTYSKNGLFNSFAEGDYADQGGLRQAVKDARYLAEKANPDRYQPEELGICVAVFPMGGLGGFGVSDRVVARFRFGRAWPASPVDMLKLCSDQPWHTAVCS